ncbi:MAG: phosphonoacetaldehyde reductase [Cypionkella sp.]|nr:phosphonoacetaldehyde reductase [Cypionkella sp.]
MSAASWQFINPVHVRFGAGVRGELAAMLGGVAAKVLIVTTARGRAQFEADAILAPIAASGHVTWVDSVTPNPGLTDTQVEIDRLSNQSFDAVVAFGGGSALDAAKALAAALARGQENRNLAQMIANPAALVGVGTLPIYALPTTSGTGSEVTPFATIWDHENAKKLSLASPHLFPKAALVDPELTHGMPRAATLSTGLDALNQAFESAWNRNGNPVSRLMAGRAIGLALDALPVLAADLDSAPARAKIAEASLLAGLCISQSRTAICHSISYPLTAHFDLAHGFACAFSMYAVAKRVAAEAPEVLASVVAISGRSDGAAVLTELAAVLAMCDLDQAIAAHLPNVDAVIALQPEMFTPGRADNFMLPMDNDKLSQILRASFLPRG